jgi:menaquinone reductase, multiheme cytochrome c subunit
MERFRFSPWVNRLITASIPVLGVGACYAVGVLAYGVSPRTTNVGYSPKQPIPYSHALHVGELKLDCRYCHTTVDKAAYAAIPPTSVCSNCHSASDSNGTAPTTAVHTASRKLLPLRESQATGKPILWQKIHDLADFVYFDHSAHVNRGVGCISCHGRVDKMEQVYQAEPLSMSWCLECHRHPEPNLRPLDSVTDMEWQPAADESREQVGARLRKELNINPSTNCSTCHR